MKSKRENERAGSSGRSERRMRRRRRRRCRCRCRCRCARSIFPQRGRTGRAKLESAKIFPRTPAVCDVKESRFPSAPVKRSDLHYDELCGGGMCYKRNTTVAAGLEGATNVGNYRIPGTPAVALWNSGPSQQAGVLPGRAGKLLIRNSSRDDVGRARWP